MSEPFRTRRYVAVPPVQRRLKRRHAVRVLVLAADAVLLFADSDPGLAGSSWWFTPGGGIDPGESPIEAAVRELAEETGLRVHAHDVLGPIAQRVVTHGFSDQITCQEETFFAVRTEGFTLDISGHTEDERLTIQGHRWWPLDALADTDHPVWPANLAELVALVGRPELWPVALDEVEESSVPI